jgi:choline dehydrogenase-like flavoprotein
MHLDLRSTLPAHHQTDVCIVGSGVAGISTARRLLALGRTVTILESGGLDYEAATAALNDGDSVGHPYYRLKDSRLRFFGGTTAIWGGRIAELDPIDFERREWVPHSGWPMSHAELQAYYAEAWKLFGLTRPETWPLPDASGPFADTQFEIKHWAFDGRFNRFTFDSCQDLVQHPRATVITHATVTDIVTSANRRIVTSVRAQSLAGRTLTVAARAFVLAAGGLENPRLLLAASGGGLGNDHDLVGRFFMEHPHARGGHVIRAQSWALLRAFGRRPRHDGQVFAALIAAGAKAQAKARMLNSSLTVAARQPAGVMQFWPMRAYQRAKHEIAPTRAGRALWMHTKRAANWLQRNADPLRPWLLHRAGRLELALLVRAEQAPHPDSRIMLSDKKDALGLPQLKLDWRLSALDIHSVESLVDLVGAEFRRLDLGEVIKADWLSAPERAWRSDPLISAHPIGGYHHMGTTRMADNPRHGVTDGFGQVHGVDNLYVAGSSLFPTSGWANPTLTLAALALRTADRIAERVEGRERRQLQPAAAASRAKSP